MIDAFVRVVSQADAKGEFLSRSQLDTIRKMVNEGNKRLDIVNYITVNAAAIYTKGNSCVHKKQQGSSCVEVYSRIFHLPLVKSFV